MEHCSLIRDIKASDSWETGGLRMRWFGKDVSSFDDSNPEILGSSSEGPMHDRPLVAKLSPREVACFR